MLGFIKKQDWGRYGKPAIALVLIGLASWLLVVNIKLYRKQREVVKETYEAAQHIQNMRDENDRLREQIANYDDEDYIEKVAREENNMQKPGEIAVSFIMPEKKDTLPAKQHGFFSFEFWADLFGSIAANFHKSL